MSDFYSNQQRTLQEEFESSGLADRLQAFIVRETFDEAAQEFVEAADFFFLSSVDQDGFPTVSHKGGDPGFVTGADDVGGDHGGEQAEDHDHDHDLDQGEAVLSTGALIRRLGRLGLVLVVHDWHIRRTV